MIRWAIKWRSENKLDGKCEHFICRNRNYILFFTKAGAIAHIKEHYSYLKKRPDLIAEPHGWKMPVPVKVEVTLTPIKGQKK